MYTVPMYFCVEVSVYSKSCKYSCSHVSFANGPESSSTSVPLLHIDEAVVVNFQRLLFRHQIELLNHHFFFSSSYINNLAILSILLVFQSLQLRSSSLSSSFHHIQAASLPTPTFYHNCCLKQMLVPFLRYPAQKVAKRRLRTTMAQSQITPITVRGRYFWKGDERVR
jgi:hypothetical protein